MTEPVAAPDAAGAFATFFAEHYATTVRGAYLLTSSAAAAEDVAQDAFRQVFERWEQIRHPSAYLWRAVTNGARSWGRRERRAAPVTAVGSVEAFDSDVVAVRTALARLSSRQREALVWRYYLGLPEREIAEAMGCPIGTVKSHLRRGLRTMREVLT